MKWRQTGVSISSANMHLIELAQTGDFHSSVWCEALSSVNRSVCRWAPKGNLDSREIAKTYFCNGIVSSSGASNVEFQRSGEYQVDALKDNNHSFLQLHGAKHSPLSFVLFAACRCAPKQNLDL